MRQLVWVRIILWKDDRINLLESENSVKSEPS